MTTPPEDGAPMTFEAFRRSFSYGSRTDMQFKYLASMGDEDAADAIARLLEAVGAAFDTGDWEHVREVAFETQVSVYRRPDVEPEVETAPFQRLASPLPEVPLALLSRVVCSVGPTTRRAPTDRTSSRSSLASRSTCAGRPRSPRSPSTRLPAS